MQALFLEALPRSPEERRQLLEARCSDDPGLRLEVEALLDRSGPTDPGLGALAAAGREVAAPERIGPYRILGVLGRGGMGVVYRAERPGGPPVALKVLHPWIAVEEIVQRFEREADALRRLDHPGIARFVDAGAHDAGLVATPFIVTELIEGESLRVWATRSQPLHDRLETLAATADAVQHAHERGVLHRDLKPENILLGKDGRPRVLDFGIARLLERGEAGSSNLTMTGLMVGTMAYMSPEQAEGGTIDARSDVYSLGVVAYELISGTLPYPVSRDSIQRSLVAILSTPPQPLPRAVDPGARRLEPVLAAALEKSPSRRTTSAARLAEDFRRVRAGQRPLARGRLGGAAAARVRLVRGLQVLGAVAVLAAIALSPAGGWLALRIQARVAPGAMVRRTYALLDSVDSRVHVLTRTPEHMREAIAFAVEARGLIDALGDAPPWRVLRRYASHREAEARFVLADHERDPDGFERAAELWDVVAASLARRTPDERLEGDEPLAERVRGQETLTPATSEALALSELARFRDPVRNQRHALAIRRAALERVLDQERLAQADPSAAAPSVLDRLLRLNELGESEAVLAALTDSASYAEDAVRHLRAAESLSPLGLDPSVLASCLHNLGVAFRERARLDSSAADLDSAATRLASALEIRRELPGYVSETYSREEAAEALRLAARNERAPGRELDRLLEARRLLLAGRDVAEPAGGPRRAYQSLLLATVEIDLASIDGPGSLGRAESLLVSTQRWHSQARAPVLFARTQRQRMRIEALRWAAGGGIEHWYRARQLHDQVYNAFSGSEWPRLRIDMNRARVALDHDPPRPPGLRFPCD